MQGGSSLETIPTANNADREALQRAREALGRIILDKDPQIRHAIAVALGRLKDRSGVPVLLEELASEDTTTRLMAIRELEQITGQDFGFSAYEKDAEVRAQAIQRAREWWQSVRGGGDGTPPKKDGGKDGGDGGADAPAPPDDGSAPAMAEGPYKDSDSGYLKVVDTFLYPVGAVLEWTIFRPLHALELRGVRGVRTGRTTREGTMHVQRGCASARPPRYCTDVRFQN